MANNINFRQAGAVAVFAAIWGALSPSSLLGTVATVAVGAFAALSVEATGKCVDDAYHELDVKSHRVEQIVYYDLDKELDSMRSALLRLKGHTKPYKLLLKTLNLKNDNELFLWFYQQFKKGCCYGHTSNFIKHLKDGKTSQTAEDVFYNQMLHYLHNNLLTRIKFIDNLIPKKASPKANWKETKLNKYEQELASLSKEELLSTFHKSKWVDPSLSLETYENYFDRNSIPYERGIMGYVAMPAHTLGFQYSPMGYFFYDPISPIWGGLLHYPDKMTFLEALRTQVLRDIAEIKRVRPVGDERIMIGISAIPDQESQG